MKGNVVDWDTAKFKLLNMSEVERPWEEVCSPINPGNVLIPDKRTFESLVDLCPKLRGTVSVTQSREVEQELSKTIKDNPSCYNDGLIS